MEGLTGIKLEKSHNYEHDCNLDAGTDDSYMVPCNLLDSNVELNSE